MKRSLKSIFVSKLSLLIICLIALAFRLYGLRWDDGSHFHPDERMLIMVADRVRLFSQLNPDFFNYGSLPIYILTGTSQLIDRLFDLQLTNYDGLLITGRLLSVFTEVLVIIFIFKVARLIFKDQNIAIWSSLFYALAFFPIQNAHFFIVDTFLNLFVIILVYLLLLFYRQSHLLYIPFIALAFAATITTKISAIIFAPFVFIILITVQATTNFKKFMLTSIMRVITFTVIAISASYVFMPFAFIEYRRFFNDISLQVQMNSDPYIFPYTLQYVGTLPYIYYLKNIFFWGLGPILSLLVIYGAYLLLKTIPYRKSFSVSFLWKQYIDKKLPIVLVSIMYFAYFLVIGKSAVKFMRYMLLMYPLFCLLAGYGFYSLIGKRGQNRFFYNGILLTLLTLITLWTIAFSQIYSTANTRHQATNWILEHVPPGFSIATEHWDDVVPVRDLGKYTHVELPLYERPDNEVKWKMINERLQQTDYIVIASNRLYVPLQKLNDCQKYKYCYPKTAEYYQKLFKNELPFVKVAEFTSYPRLKFGSFELTISDDTADESFTVYDHPKIYVFKNKKIIKP